MKTVCLLVGALALACPAASAGTIDVVRYPDGVRLAPFAEAFWRSAPHALRLRVDPRRDNYLSVRLWGGDVSHDHLLMTIDGEALGQMHLGEVDILDYESCWPRDFSPREEADPEHAGVFVYRTFLLPRSKTEGKESVEVRIYATGKIWGYGRDFAQFQKNVTHPSRAVYGAATHTDPAGLSVDWGPARPPAAVAPPVPPAPALDPAAVREDVRRRIEKLLRPGELARHPDQLPFVAAAYHEPDTPASGSAAAADAIAAAIDATVAKWRAEPAAVIPEGTWSAGRQEAEGLVRLGVAALGARLDDARRREWADFFAAAADYLFTHRRFFANQTQIVDISCHWNARAAKLLDPSRGPSLADTESHLEEAMGLKPCPNGYVTLTRKGLSREDGYVGTYGESTIVAAIEAYEATVDPATGEGNRRLKARMEQAIVARTVFRYRGVRRDGSPVMRLECPVSWRNEHFPGMPTYLTGGNYLLTPWLLTGNLRMLGAIRAAEEAGWLARFVRGEGERKPSGRELMAFVSGYPQYRAAVARHRDLPTLPMLDKDDFVFSNAEIGMVVAKWRDEAIYVNCFWRARGAINNLAKVHYLRPDGEYQATVHCDEEFRPRPGKTKTAGDYFQYGWIPRLYDGYRAPAPDGGDDGPWPPRNLRAGIVCPVGEKGGRADFYHVSYGPYEIYLNDSGAAREIVVPAGDYELVASGAKALAQGGDRSTLAPGKAAVYRRVGAVPAKAVHSKR